MLAFPADVATWIRDHALTPTYLRNTVDPTLCACQYGTCGHCGADRHIDCHTAVWGASPSPDTYLCAPTGAAVARLWRIGTPCRWACACTCRTRPLPVQPEQLDLFADLAA